MTSAVAWEPGEPLHEPGVFIRPMCEVIEDNFTGRRPSPDAARWPEPMPHDDIGTEVRL